MSPKLHGRALRLTGAGLLLLMLLGMLPRPGAPVAPPGHGFSGASALGTGTALADERPVTVPFPLIEREQRRRVRALTENATIVRRLPARPFRTDMHIYQYLLDNLPLSSKLSGLLGFGRYRVTELEGGRLHGEDRRGISGDFWVVYADQRKRVFLGEGSYDSWFMPKISGEVVLVVEYEEAAPELNPGRGQSVAVVTRVDVYVKTNKLVGYIIEILGATADKKLTKLISSAQLTSEKISSDPHRVWRTMISSGLFAPGELESFRRAVMTPAGVTRESTPQGPNARQ